MHGQGVRESNLYQPGDGGATSRINHVTGISVLGCPHGTDEAGFAGRSHHMRVLLLLLLTARLINSTAREIIVAAAGVSGRYKMSSRRGALHHRTRRLMPGSGVLMTLGSLSRHAV